MFSIIFFVNTVCFMQMLQNIITFIGWQLQVWQHNNHCRKICMYHVEEHRTIRKMHEIWAGYIHSIWNWCLCNHMDIIKRFKPKFWLSYMDKDSHLVCESFSHTSRFSHVYLDKSGMGWKAFVSMTPPMWWFNNGLDNW